MMKGVRVFCKQPSASDVTLLDILSLVCGGSEFYWGLLFIDGVINSRSDLHFIDIQKRVNESEGGLALDWLSLKKIGHDFFQIYEICILGAKDKQVIRRYNTDQEMYVQCDVVVELVDCVFWEIHTQDEVFAAKIKTNFKKVERID